MRKREREPMMNFSSLEFISFDRSSALFLGDFDFFDQKFSERVWKLLSPTPKCKYAFQTLFS